MSLSRDLQSYPPRLRFHRFSEGAFGSLARPGFLEETVDVERISFHAAAGLSAFSLREQALVPREQYERLDAEVEPTKAPQENPSDVSGFARRFLAV